MKILLDENTPKRLRLQDQPEVDEVSTIREMGWAGKMNGELMGLLTFNGFDVFITLDKSQYNQQNLSKFSVTVILLRVKTNKYEDIQAVLPELFVSLGNRPIGKLIIIGS